MEYYQVVPRSSGHGGSQCAFRCGVPSNAGRPFPRRRLLNPLDTLQARLKRGFLPASPASAGILDTIRGALSSAGLDPDSGVMADVTRTIRQALGQTRPMSGADTVGAGNADLAARLQRGALGGPIIDVVAHEVRNDDLPGRFESHSFSCAAGTRAYRLYVPAAADQKAAEGSAREVSPMPLVVMLHGCKQSPEDFAAGTRMNELAERHGLLVAYPAQAQHANGSNCWNWFRSQDQARGAGEPSIIAGIVGQVAATHRIDERRIYVAGLSAGAAMAVILGETYPEVFAAVGAHSGLPYGAAGDLPSAFAAMAGNAPARMARVPAPDDAPATSARAAPAAGSSAQGVPTIVFHGDSDRTVDQRNATRIADRAIARQAAGLRRTIEAGTTPDGRGHERIVHADAHGTPVVEQWFLHGAGHAWAGGSSRGSFTDPCGPDASAQMLRFFALHRRTDPA